MSTTLPNPLLQVYEQAEAELQSYGTVQIVSTFNEPEAEYAAIRKSAALMDLPQRGVLEFTGDDRLTFLNNLLTNQIWDKRTGKGLPPGQGVYAFLLNNKGRIVADMNVLELGDRTLLEMDGRMVDPVAQAFEKYLFREKVKLTSGIGSLHSLALHGPGAKQILDQVLASPLPANMPQLGSIAGKMLNADVVIWRDDETLSPGYHLIVPIASAHAVWMELVGRFAQPAALGKRPLRPIGWAAFNAARIEAARPIFGIDFDETVLPAETAQFERAVSMAKGCYLGQEIVARMQSRQQLPRRLAGIRMQSDALPLAASPIEDEAGEQVGVVTSSTISPLLSGVAICLGLLKKPFFEVAAKVRIPAEGSVHQGEVVNGPFVNIAAGGHSDPATEPH